MEIFGVWLWWSFALPNVGEWACSCCLTISQPGTVSGALRSRRSAERLGLARRLRFNGDVFIGPKWSFCAPAVDCCARMCPNVLPEGSLDLVELSTPAGISIVPQCAD